MIPQSEGDLKNTCADYLQYGMNQGKWWFTRLNCGEAFVKKGGKDYKIELCEEGTADFEVIKQNCVLEYTDVLFIELKSEKGKQSPEQGSFQKIVEAQGCKYYLLRSFEELEALLK